MIKSKVSSSKIIDKRIVEQIREALDIILESHSESLIMGEDISDPYGGAFKVTRGLSNKYNQKVIHTPISEAGFTAVATGLTCLGFKPIIEIMFGDFVTLVTEVLINHTSKFRWFSQDKIKGSLIVRFPVGGGRGYGPIHSQSLEKIFFGWPEIKVFSPNRLVDNCQLLIDVYNDDTPVKLFVENKLDYAKKNHSNKDLSEMGFTLSRIGDRFPTVVLDNSDGERCDAIIFCYGGMLRHTLQASYDLLIEEEVTSKIIIPTQIFPVEIIPFMSHLSNFKKLLFIEEGYSSSGWGSCLITELVNSGGISIGMENIRILGPEFKPIPVGIEDEKKHFLSSVDIKQKVLELLND